jgi:TldD protein
VYAEARWVGRTIERLHVSGGAIERVDCDTDEGVGIRVAAPGRGFAFAATREVTKAGLERALARAVELAQALPAVAERPLPPPIAAARGDWRSEYEVDPFRWPLEERLALLLEAEGALHVDPRIVRSEAQSLAIATRIAFASSDGAAVTQERIECGAGIAAHAASDGELQTRSYPSGHGGSTALAGFEHVVGLELAAQAPRIAEEALMLLSAPPCPAGRTTLVVGPEQLALQVHESIGHALELDRMLLDEASYAGTSWVSPEDLGTLRYGSEHLHVSADATLAGGLGSFGWDDEGVAAGRTMLIEGGILRAALSDRQSAARVGVASSGAARADGFARQPIVRMTNVSIEPDEHGPASLEELIAGVEDGIYMETNRSWSIDDRRLHFQFGTEVGHEIRDGELGRLVRNPTYAGVTPQFWGSLEAICGPAAWRLHGLLNCGKGEPGQVAHVSHGAAPARFRDVEVGVLR